MTWQGQGAWSPPAGPPEPAPPDGRPAPFPPGSVLPGPTRGASVLPGGRLPSRRRSRPGAATVLPVVAAVLVVALLVTVSVVLLRTLTREQADPGPARSPRTTAGGEPVPASGPATGPATGPAAPEALPAVLTARPAPGAPPVGPGSVKVVFDALWDLREQAMADRDVAALARFEDGSALFGDTARAGCGCPLRDATRYDELELYVPRQTRYPVRFLAWTVTPGRDDVPLAELTVVTRAKAGSPWRISFHTLFTAQQVGPLRAGGDQDGYVAVPSREVHRVALRAPAALAELWGDAKRTGRVGDLGMFRSGEWTSVEAAAYAAHRDGAVQDNGLLSRNRFWADPADPLYEFTTADGSELACGVVHRQVVYRGRWGQSPVQDRARRNWGPELAPGRYDTVTVDSRSQSCFLVAPQDLEVEVVGGQALVESVTSGTR